MKSFVYFLSIVSLALLCSFPAQADNSDKKITLGLMGMGNIQLVNSSTNIDPGPGGGVFFDYRFNHRFSMDVNVWATTHDGTGGSKGDNSIQILGIPTATIKLYLNDNENSRWDPYLGIGIGVYAMTEGSLENNTNGVGMGGKVDFGCDYKLTDILSVGLDGVFNSAGIITGLNGGNASHSNAIIPYSLIAKVGFHL